MCVCKFFFLLFSHHFCSMESCEAWKTNGCFPQFLRVDKIENGKSIATTVYTYTTHQPMRCVRFCIHYRRWIKVESTSIFMLSTIIGDWNVCTAETNQIFTEINQHMKNSMMSIEREKSVCYHRVQSSTWVKRRGNAAVYLSSFANRNNLGGRLGELKRDRCVKVG